MVDASATPVLPFARRTPARITTVRVERDDAFARLTPHQRQLLLVRVLCELVAYEADVEPHAVAS